MLIKVKAIVDNDLDQVFGTLSKGIEPATTPYSMTYNTNDENIKTGDIVIVNINRRRKGYSENVMAIVNDLLTDKTVNDFDFDIKSVLAVIKPDGALKEARVKAQQQMLMKKMKARAEQISQLDTMKRLAETDPEMKAMVERYEKLEK